MEYSMAINKTAAPAKTEDTSVVLELAHYGRYWHCGEIYEKGEAYRFTAEQADDLLQATDEHTGLPVWRRWKPAAKRVMVEREVVPNDMTSADLSPSTAKAISVGDDADIADHLAGGEEAHTV
jgi:hypothetical protein